MKAASEAPPVKMLVRLHVQPGEILLRQRRGIDCLQLVVFGALIYLRDAHLPHCDREEVWTQFRHAIQNLVGRVGAPHLVGFK